MALIMNKNSFDRAKIQTILDGMAKITAYAYIRFSSAQQEEGDSVRRQKDLVQKVLQAHPTWTLARYIEDMGVSGFTGENLKEGPFADFLTSCARGRCPRTAS